MSIDSQLPSTQNNPYAKEAYFRVVNYPASHHYSTFRGAILEN